MADRYPPRHLLDHKFDEDSRAVLADWHEQHAVPMTDIGWWVAAAHAYSDIYAASHADDDAEDMAADDAAADDDDADADADDADADADDADADDADAADAADDDDGEAIGTQPRYPEQRLMENGLYVLRLRGGWYGRGISRVGWLRHKIGDWWELLPGACRVRRLNSDMTELGDLAVRGLTPNHFLGEPQPGIQVIHVVNLVHIFPADRSAWPQLPMPPGQWL